VVAVVVVGPGTVVVVSGTPVVVVWGANRAGRVDAGEVEGAPVPGRAPLAAMCDELW
jgi:hypothetical protein